MSRKFVSGGGYRLKGLGTTCKVSSLKSRSSSSLHSRGIFHSISHFKPSTLLTSLSLIALFALSAFSLSSILYPSVPSSANSSSTTLAVGASVQEFLRLAVDVSEVALADSQGHTTISPDPNNGTQITGDINVAVTTNTGNGYNLTVATQDNTKNMSHSLPNVDATINSIDTISGYDASTGASSLSNNTWGFRKNTGTSEDPVYTNWYAVGAKDSTGTVIDSPGEGTGSYCDSLSYPLNQSGCNPSSYRTYNINVGAKLTSSLPAGTYTNDIVFSATTKSEGTKYTMNFNSNGGNNGNIINPRIVIAGLSTILPTSGFTKDGMGIKGWAFKSGVTPSTANTSADTTMYNAGQSVAINDLLASAISAGQNPSTNNSFTVYAVWETAYTINFNKNSNEAIGSMNPDTPIIQSATYTIPTATFTREDYNFIGWALSASDAESGTVAYTAGQTPTVSSLITAAQAAGQTVTPGAAGTITLYVVWELARDTRTLADITYMQDINSDIIENTANGATASLRDSRDNQYYTVYKIPTNTVYAGTSTVANIAGKLIMTKDLNLGAVNSVSGASSSITAQGTMNLSPQDSAFSTPTGSGESITVPTTTTAVTHGTPGTGDNYYTNRQYRIDGTGNYAGRGYYTWGAAMLACPKNWRLPTSDEYTNSDSWEGQTAGLAAIVKGANASTTISNITSSPWSFVLGGYYSIGFNNAGSRGYYWSTTQGGSTSSYHLYMDSSSGLLRNNYDKRIGFAVRCVAD